MEEGRQMYSRGTGGSRDAAAFALEAEVALYAAGGLNDREAEGFKQAGECW